jgi:hypothetical protein
MLKQVMREETERLVKEALKRKTVTVKLRSDSRRDQMRKVRSAKSHLSSPGAGSGVIHLQGMWRKAKDVVTADR